MKTIPSSAPTVRPPRIIPSSTRCGSSSRMTRSLNVPGSLSSALQTTYFGRTRLLAHHLPLDAGGKAGAAHTAQAAVLERLHERCGVSQRLRRTRRREQAPQHAVAIAGPPGVRVARPRRAAPRWARAARRAGADALTRSVNGSNGARLPWSARRADGAERVLVDRGRRRHLAPAEAADLADLEP